MVASGAEEDGESGEEGVGWRERGAVEGVPHLLLGHLGRSGKWSGRPVDVSF